LVVDAGDALRMKFRLMRQVLHPDADVVDARDLVHRSLHPSAAKMRADLATVKRMTLPVDIVGQLPYTVI
jgi:hypothetical protein